MAAVQKPAFTDGLELCAVVSDDAISEGERRESKGGACGSCVKG